MEILDQLKEIVGDRVTGSFCERCCYASDASGYKDLSMRLAKKRLEDVPRGVDCIVTYALFA